MARKPGVAPSLTRDEIAAAALTLADEVGLPNVSVRRLAAELGKSPMALYTYFDSAAQIHAHAVALAFRAVDADPVPGERWDDTLRRTTRSIRQVYLDHPAADLTSVDSAGYAEAFREHTERIYALHSAQGIPPQVLRTLWCVVDAFLGGFIPAELAELRIQAARPDPQGRAWMETAENAYNEQTFASGIETIIAGTRALAAPDPCDWRTPTEDPLQK